MNTDGADAFIFEHAYRSHLCSSVFIVVKTSPIDDRRPEARGEPRG
jgi:hypothetical protein